MVALSPAPCRRWLRRLEEADVVVRYAALVDARKVGLGVAATLDVTLDKQAEHARRMVATAAHLTDHAPEHRRVRQREHGVQGLWSCGEPPVNVDIKSSVVLCFDA